MAKRNFYYVVNGITLYRLIAAPVLIILIFNNQQDLFRWMLAFSFFTDAIDGWLARRQKVTSILGSRLDSIADDITVMAAIAGIIVWKPEFLRQERIMIIVLLVLFLTQVMVSFIRYGRMSSFHTYGAKLAAILQGLFLVLFFWLPNPVYPLFYAAAFVTAAELAEEIILVLLLPKWQANVKGLYWVLKRR